MEQEKFYDEVKNKDKISVMEDKNTNKKYVLIDGKIYMSYDINDIESQRIAVVQLFESGISRQEEIGRAFGIHINSVQNYINRFSEEGYKGLLTQRRGPIGAWKITASNRSKILWIVFNKRTTNITNIKDELKDTFKEEISENSIRQVLIENGIIEHREMIKMEQMNLLEKDDFSTENIQLELNLNFDEKVEEKEDVDNNRDEVNNKIVKYFKEKDSSFRKKGLSYYSEMEREYLDRLERGSYSSYGAGLLFVPMLKRYKFLDTIKEIIKIDTHEGYKLEQLALTLFYFSLFEFRSIEDFKTAYSDEFGILIGRINSPSIDTLRRFLHKVRKLNNGEELIYKFGKKYLESNLVKWGKLYIDEHFLPYYGIEEISYGYYTVRDRAFTGSYNFVAVDEDYNPLIFLIRESSEDLIKKIPELIEKAKEIAKGAGITEEERNKLTVIFDRGAYSGELFRSLDSSGIKFITWAKNIEKFVDKIDEEKFKEITRVKYKIQKSKEITYYEENKNVSKYGKKIRAILIKRIKDKRVGVIYTNDRERSASEIIQIMCTRWGQENFIKAMKLDYRIDYMPGYVTEEIKEQPMVDNPKIEELKQERSKLTSKLNEYKVAIGEKVLKEVDKGSKGMDLEKIKKEEIYENIAMIESKTVLINQKIDELPKKIKYDEAYGEKLVRFDYEKKRFMDCIKTFSYLMEKKMCEILMEEHIPPKEVWTVLEMITRRGAEIKLEDGKLRVKIKDFRDGAVGYAAMHLCARMNEIGPYTIDKHRIPIHYEVG